MTNNELQNKWNPMAVYRQELFDVMGAYSD